MSTVKETENLKRLNFNKMMDSILDAISNDSQYELFKNSLLCDKDNQYRKQRKAFHVILQAFGIDEDSDIFKIKNEYSFYCKHQKYITQILSEFTSKEFKKMRVNYLRDLDANYIVKSVDDFCKFIEPYVDSDNYNKLRSKIYKKTRYYAVYQNKYFDKMKEVLDVIFKGIREPRVCYCQKRLKDLKKQFISNKKDTECIGCNGNWDSQNKCCKLKYISADNNYTEFSEYSALCKKEDSNMYAEKMLSAEDRLTWLKFVYNKFKEWIDFADDVLEKMEELRNDEIIDALFELELPPNYTELIYYKYIEEQAISKVFSGEKYKTFQKQINAMSNNHRLADEKKKKELKEELDNWLIQQRKSEFKKILKQESNQEKNDDEIEEILNVLDEVKDLKNKSFRNSEQLLKDAIEELD